MRIGIITKIGKNYGALLQAYALKKTFDNFEAETHIIKYTPINSNKTYSIFKYKWGLRGFFANTKSLLHWSSIKNGSNKMLQFRERYLSMVGSYCSNDELINNPPDADIFVTGSDQVWNPLLSFDSSYYLDFNNLNKNIKKASYSASIGLKEIPKEYEKKFVERLKKMDYITVREKNAQKILNNYNIKSTVTPDPTLLLTREEWDKLVVEPVTPEKYILCYFVSFRDEYKKIVDTIQKKLGYKVINLMTSEESSKVGDIKVRDASVEEFLGYIKNAEFVITSSYHGTIFSVIFEKQFCSMVYKQTSSRLTELLDNFKLSNRIVSSDDLNRINDVIDNPCFIDSKIKREIREKGLKEINKIINL